MAINAYGNNAATATTTQTATTVKDKTKLNNNDFMQLLLTELQYQDPTQPMDTEKILSQTSQLATLESSDKTNTALKSLATSLGSSQQFSTIAAIGKTADLGSDAITHNKGTDTTFEVYFPKAVKQGTVSITDSNGNTVQTLDVGSNTAGVYKFTWDGSNTAGNQADSAIYHVNAQYTDTNGDTQQTRLGAYPIESVRFNGDNTYLKLGSNYVSLANIKEVY